MANTTSPASKQPEPKPIPGVRVGDEVYFSHKSGPKSGRVTARGAHGITCDAGGEAHKVHWHEVLGHKKRIQHSADVVDRGEDGAILQHPDGRRSYMAIPPEAREQAPAPMRKALPSTVLFVKGGPIANRPGLTLTDETDRNGKHTKRWERAGAAPAGATPHKPGDMVHVDKGALQGKHMVQAAGQHGAIVQDGQGAQHRVEWEHIKPHDAAPPAGGGGSGGGGEPPDEGQQPIHPDRFGAADYAKRFDQADVTPEHVLSHFPPDTKDKIADVEKRLAAAKPTVETHSADGKTFSPEREELHNSIIRGMLNPKSIAAAKPAPGEKPKFIMLGGRGGSGKSSFGKAKSGVAVYDPKKFIVLDPDKIKEQLPEYKGWNAAQVHEESGIIFDQIVQAARGAGLNVVLDKTMKSPTSAVADVNAFKAAGYQTEAHYMHLPRQEAAKRAVHRFLNGGKEGTDEEGRYVPVNVVLANKDNEKNFDEVRKHVDRWSFHDNNVAKGTKPILISHGDNKTGPRELKKSLTSPIILLRR